MMQIYGGRWETVASLGEGGQAYTYAVHDRAGEIPGLSVLKRLKKLSRVMRFKSEIEAVQQLSHPAIVKLIDAELKFAETVSCDGVLTRWGIITRRAVLERAAGYCAGTLRADTGKCGTRALQRNHPSGPKAR
jgi:hypothetical protein